MRALCVTRVVLLAAVSACEPHAGRAPIDAPPPGPTPGASAKVLARTAPRGVEPVVGPSGSLLWQRRIDATQGAIATAAAVAVDGSVFVGGEFRGAMRLGRPLSSAGDADAFMARLTPSGDVDWAHSFGGAGQDDLRAIALGGDGVELWAAGHFGATLVASGFQPTQATAGGSPLLVSDQRAAFVARYDPVRGGHRSSSVISDAPFFSIDALVGHRDGVVGAGMAGAGVDRFGGAARTSTMRGTDALVVRLREDGAVAWSHHMSGNRIAAAALVAVDARGTTAVAGKFDGDLWLDDVDLKTTSRGDSDVFVVCFAPDGTLTSVTRRGTVLDEAPGALALLNDGDIVLSWTEASGDHAGVELIVERMSPSGGSRWQRRIARTSGIYSRGIVSIGDRLVIAGPLEGGADFGGTSLEGLHSPAFVMGLDGSGQVQWTKVLDGIGLAGAVASPDRSVVLYGFHATTERVSAGGPSFTGLTSGFVAKIIP